MTKFCIYSAALINQIKYDFGKTLSMKNSEFIDNGKGNIIFSNVSLNYYDILENIQMIILLYELILKFRKKEFLDSLNFYLCLPISRDDFISHSKELNSYFVNLLEERKIKINWNHKINEVKSNNIIKFEILEENELNDRATEIKTNSNKKCIEMEYNFAYVLPKLVLPSFIRYSPIFEVKNKIESDTKKLNLTDKFENISVIGDALINNNFLDRFYPNIVRQAEVISSNLKASHFRLGKSYLKEYIPTKKIYFDFKMENYLLFDTSDGNHESLKKSQWNNFLFKHLYFRPEGFYAQRFLLKRKLE